MLQGSPKTAQGCLQSRILSGEKECDQCRGQIQLHDSFVLPAAFAKWYIELPHECSQTVDREEGSFFDGSIHHVHSSIEDFKNHLGTL